MNTPDATAMDEIFSAFMKLTKNKDKTQIFPSVLDLAEKTLVKKNDIRKTEAGRTYFLRMLHSDNGKICGVVRCKNDDAHTPESITLTHIGNHADGKRNALKTYACNANDGFTGFQAFHHPVNNVREWALEAKLIEVDKPKF